MSLFNRSKMRAKFAAMVGAVVSRAAHAPAGRPSLAPVSVPPSPESGFDPLAFFASVFLDASGRFGILPGGLAAASGAGAVLGRLAAWRRAGPRGYHHFERNHRKRRFVCRFGEWSRVR